MSDATILFEDERVIAANKPAGQPTIPGRGDLGEPLNVELERRLGSKLFVVHRLDLGASGVVVFAKDAQTHRLLCAQFESRAAKKIYLAAVSGVMRGEGITDVPLKEFSSGRTGTSPKGRDALTRWRVERVWSFATLLRVNPQTGRRHQIRAHLCSLGHPILGDALYGPPPRPIGGVPRLMLHALSLTLPLEFGYEFLADPPDDFTAILASLK